jgi:hypothetical protein
MLEKLWDRHNAKGQVLHLLGSETTWICVAYKVLSITFPVPITWEVLSEHTLLRTQGNCFLLLPRGLENKKGKIKHEKCK